MAKFVLISKDAMCTEYLPVYGNKRWHTPNMDALAANGTVFHRHYAAAPSTIMSFYSMVTGKFAHETKYEMYERIHDVYQGETLFTKLAAKGWKSHIVWGDIWRVVPEYFDCYRSDVTLHLLDGFRQGVGAHYIHEGFLQPDEAKQQATFELTAQTVREILDTEENTFLWVHFPHVINGEVAYGSDIELFDRCIGYIRELVPDDCIAITSDHGNMNGHKGKVGYGFDLEDPAIRIPLITPRKQGIAEYDGLTSNVDLHDLLFSDEIPKREIIYSDSAYRAQQHRKLAILRGDYKYIYSKKTGKEVLYDLREDPTEEFSLMEDYCIDPDRKVRVPSRELYYYPAWEQLEKVRSDFRAEKQRIWKNGSRSVILKSNLKDMVRPLYKLLHRKKVK